MAMMKCPECGKEISDKAEKCPSCGCPSSEWNDANMKLSNLKEKDIYNIIEKISGKYNSKEKIKIIKELRIETGMGLKEAEDAVENYFSCENEEEFIEKFSLKNVDKIEFNGIYRYSILGKIEVRCPRCRSENCSHYQEQKIVPGKTKTRYTANLNPLKPFTLVNKKEKIKRKDKLKTESKFLCNECGKIFN